MNAAQEYLIQIKELYIELHKSEDGCEDDE